MKRWRRPLLVITLLLLGGAVVNVAVAWVLVGAPDSWTPGGPRWSDDPGRLRGWSAHLNPPPSHGSIARGLGWTLRSDAASAVGAAGQTRWFWDNTRLEAGWPMRSTFVEWRRPAGSVAIYSPSIGLPRGLQLGSQWFERAPDRLPLTPIPAGFAINTLFYTAILALPLSVFPIRRRLRARRGRCPKCGYDRTGLADPAGPCPECGRRQ